MKRTTIASTALAALVASGVAGLAGLAGNSASAATTDSSTTAITAAASDSSTATTPAAPHTANGKTETPLVGDELTKATAAAATAAPGSTVVRAETDADGDVFEVHITNADGTKSTVKLNADFSVKTIEAGGKGGHGGKGGGSHGTETPLTGDDLAKATAAAAKAAPGSTVVRAETDADGAAFEVHITNTDGTKSTVLLNADFSLKTIETGATK
jgi:uncharacterized membrane protein YkoI